MASAQAEDSPAHTGIHPGRLRLSRGQRRLPRTHGDPPKYLPTMLPDTGGAAALLRSSRSPHGTSRIVGCPARTGIHQWLPLRLAADWLHGDPPKWRFRPASFCMAAPLARG